MKIKSGREKEYEIYVENNSKNRYSKAVIDYLERWANLMEKRIADGDKIYDIAEQTSYEADTEGITGFMYGCAVNILSQLWEYGEDLRKWHNKEYGYEGEGVVNPAVLTVE